jgi:hypothetical protein
MARTRGKALAQKRKDFWILIFSGQGLSYTELRHMDADAYYEAVEAFSLFHGDWKKGGG